MKTVWVVSLLAVTGCGSGAVQASAVTCADGGVGSMCAAQQSAAPEAGVPVVLVHCEGKRDCVAGFECREHVCTPKPAKAPHGHEHHDDDDDDGDCDD